MVRYNGNIFKAAYWAGSAPGENPTDGWRLQEEIYTGGSSSESKVIGYLPTWRK